MSREYVWEGKAPTKSLRPYNLRPRPVEPVPELKVNDSGMSYYDAPLRHGRYYETPLRRARSHRKV